MIRRLFDRLLDLLFPWGSRCLGCERQLGNQHDRYLCDECAEQFQVQCHIKESDALKAGGVEICCAPFRYEGPVVGLIHGMKYGALPGIARETLAPCMAEMLRARKVQCDLVIPVPLHPRRAYDRGYNQSALLAQGVGEALGVPVSGALKRVRYTKSQARLSHEARQSNLTGAFSCGAEVAGKRVLLIDDVFTTGSTAMECARALRKAGAVSVQVCTAAMAASGAKTEDI